MPQVTVELILASNAARQRLLIAVSNAVWNCVKRSINESDALLRLQSAIFVTVAVTWGIFFAVWKGKAFCERPFALNPEAYRGWMAPGARSKYGTLMFEPEVFRKQLYCIEESTYDIVGTFRRSPQSFGAPVVIRRPGNCSPCPPSLRPWLHRQQPEKDKQNVDVALPGKISADAHANVIK